MNQGFLRIDQVLSHGSLGYEVKSIDVMRNAHLIVSAIAISALIARNDLEMIYVRNGDFRFLGK